MLDPTQLAALKVEIALPAYAGMDEPTIARTLNTRNIASDVDASVESINRYLAENGILGKIDARIEFHRGKVRTATSINDPAEIKLAALRTMQLALQRLPTFRTSVGSVKSAVFALIENLYLATDAAPTPGEGLITLQQRNQLRALASGFITRGEALFGPGVIVESGDVSRAKAL